ncbi:hypothetical protein PF005_g28574 [Phytophthora fragariae]|uniref:Uncharacterized protein n=1 Tax=Phytophthora fragariae TaxID=53985 RepID=A0A6A4BG12_9STRA|nr:hypothetical protein PF009_g26199 [Phytophthora fragariae]KAE8975399.1 hypothetical protein PF011_g24487 [Phytophthora fragariae]KAE9068698.1 hypothetical protein PF006_g29741 [Phytophthora fragariae]KAE9072963.1 hypothetical protein PF007_g25986 [Phytophthora fragariae]KAE9167970.1 hypothetical protein PF005_g28574 [Phytophthora fragariae]
MSGRCGRLRRRYRQIRGPTRSFRLLDIVNKQIPAFVKPKEDGNKAGLEINFHGDEMHPLQYGTTAADLGARAILHCEKMLTPEDLQDMARKPEPVFVVLLLTTKFIPKLPNPPARDMITASVPVTLGSDYNPNVHCLSMPLTVNMAQ